MMMVAMQGVNKFGSPRCFWHPVKNKPVCYVFKKCPEKHAAKKDKQNAASAEIIPCSGRVNKKSHDRDIHSPYHQWMGFCQCLKEITFK